MILSVSADRADALTEVLQGEGETVTRLGTVTAGEGMRYAGKLL
jgi:phosphoribosylformylglycinamidine cyclo-ligase